MAEVLALIGLGLAAPGVVDVFIRAGQYLVSRLREDQRAKDYVSDLEAFLERSYTERLMLHIRLAQSLLADPTVDSLDKSQLLGVFEDIKSAMRAIDDSISILVAPRDILNFRRGPTRATLKKQTKRCKELLGDFRERVMALRDLRATESDLFLTDHDFQWVVSGASTALNPKAFIRRGRVSREIKGVQPEVRQFLYEARPYSSNNKDFEKINIKILSQKLDAAEKVDPGILPILGFRDDVQKQEFQLLFIIPQAEDTARTLAKFMQEVGDMPSLNCRTELCVQLAEALLHVHSVRLVHKSIRPDNIIVFSPNNDHRFTEVNGRHNLRLFLLGWHYARTIDYFSTQRAGERLWQRRLYQHPERQRRQAEADYSMGHDVYSLGVCILEILSWKPLVIYIQDDQQTQQPELSPEYQQMFLSLHMDNSGTDSPVRTDMNWMMQNPYQVQQVLLSLSDAQLPKMTGRRLACLVHDCITLLDNEEEEDSICRSESQREAGSDFVDRVLAVIRSVSEAV